MPRLFSCVPGAAQASRKIAAYGAESHSCPPGVVSDAPSENLTDDLCLSHRQAQLPRSKLIDVIATVRHEADEERELAARAGSGEHAAFAVLFERYKAGIYRFCLYMLNDAASADDLYQEVFINFYRACREGKEMTNVRGYLMTAARTRCINALKSSRRLTSIEDHDDAGFEIDPSSPDTAEHLRDALQRIPAQYREVFLMFELEGYSYLEIGSQLGISHDVIKNRIYRAKQALQKILRPLLR